MKKLKNMFSLMVFVSATVSPSHAFEEAFGKLLTQKNDVFRYCSHAPLIRVSTLARRPKVVISSSPVLERILG